MLYDGTVNNSNLLWTPKNLYEISSIGPVIFRVVCIKGKFDWASSAFTLNFKGLFERGVFGTTVYVFTACTGNGKYLPL